MINKKLLTFAFFLAVGLGVAAVGYGDITGQADFTESYTQVDAEVSEIEFETYVVESTYTTRETEEVEHHQPTVQYTYSYDGEKYTQQTRLAPYTGSIEQAKNEVSKNYDIGDKKTIYVSESSPDKVSPNKPSKATSYLLVAFGLLISLCTVVLGNKSRKS